MLALHMWRRMIGESMLTYTYTVYRHRVHVDTVEIQEMHVWSRRFLHYSSLTLPTGERLAGCRSWSTSSYRLHKPKTASSQKDTHKTSSSSQMNQFPSQINEFNVSHILIFIFYLECCEWTLFIYYQLCTFKDHTMVNHEWVKLHAIHASDRV